MTSHEIRNCFIKYFESQGHTHVASSGLIPENDNTLLFANAGMNQFKNVFLGLDKRPYARATTSQKCVRAGGKHNDLENVGHTARHHTFFEMLGNFSFGDYFKKDAIHFAWELLTKKLGLPKEKLYVSVFETDDEAADIWHKQEGVARERIFRFGEKDNFWRMGDTGPCGPCTEIFYDHGPKAGCGKPTCTVGCSCDRYVEIWNLVFMQFYEDETGKKNPLPKPSVDTGAGLERVTAAIQGKFNNYDTDLFAPMINTAARIAKVKYETEKPNDTTVALRVLADHARSTAFLIGDGVIPTNEGRGYVLRRIMRRGIRFGRNLTKDVSLFPAVVSSVIDSMSSVYPELKRNSERILTMTKDEVSRFITTLDQGTEILNMALDKTVKQKNKVLDGAIVFKLYDTFGFPADLTQLIARERGIEIDEETFEKEMSKAKEIAKATWKGQGIADDRAHLVSIAQGQLTEFKGYETTSAKGKILVISDGKTSVKTLSVGQKGYIIADSTPFYGEGGGQVGDQGEIKGSGTEVEVLNCTKENDIYIHHINVKKGKISVGETYEFEVLASQRRRIASNHSATHLLHAALRKILGTHVGQAGSHVDAERLRFDFTHSSPLTAKERKQIEELVNQEIFAQREVNTKITTPKEAVEKDGALAFFGEKYGDKVRVIKMGNFSIELCGGTHVGNTSQILAFKIVSEGSVSAGVRRIEAITGPRAVEFLLKNTNEYLEAREAISANENWQQFMEKTTNPVTEWIDKSRTEIKNLERQMKQAQSQKVDVDTLIKNAHSVKFNGQEAKVASAVLELDDRQVLSDIADKMKSKLGNGVVIVIGKGEGSHPIIVTVSANLTAKIKAGDVLKSITTIMGGKGGGRPDFAQGAGVDFSKAKSAIDSLLN